MRALILAAGRGSRLRPLTDCVPKCLVQVAGRTLLEWQLAALASAGIHEVAVVTGYRARAFTGLPVRLFRNRAWRRTNMVESLLAARGWIASASCVVAYGDVLYHPRILRRLMRSRAAITLPYDTRWRGLWEERFADPATDAESFRVDRGRVMEIGGRRPDLARVQGQFMGLLGIAPAGWAAIENHLAALDAATRARLQTTELLQRLVDGGTEVRACAVGGGWCEVDSTHDLQLYERRLRAPTRWTHDFRPEGRTRC